MIRYLIPLLLVLLVACSPDVPKSFAAPAEERERLEDALDASCAEERTGYWFCTAENGFFHIFIEASRSTGNLVKTVMLDGNSDPALKNDIAALYGFTAEQLEAVSEGQAGEAVVGGFVLRLDPTWKEPIIQVHAMEPSGPGK